MIKIPDCVAFVRISMQGIAEPDDHFVNCLESEKPVFVDRLCRSLPKRYVAVFVVDSGRVLLGWRKSVSIVEVLDGFAGSLNDDETPEEAAVRYISKEAGITVEIVDTEEKSNGLFFSRQ